LVVAVIVAILAAVAIPAYNGYIINASNDVAKNTAGAIAAMAASEVSRGTSITPGSALAGDVLTIGDKSIRMPENVQGWVTADNGVASHDRGDAEQSVSFNEP